MAHFGNRVEMLTAVNFVESQFPNRQAPYAPHNNGGMYNPAHSHPPRNDLLPPPGIPADEYCRSLPDFPPPGLVRIHPPTPAPLRVINNENASLFGDFAHYLDERVDEEGKLVVFDFTCCICLESKLQVSDRVVANGPDHPCEQLSVLPCGHFIGADCLYEWLVSGHTMASCPLCRFELVYSCGHAINPREYNPLGYRRAQIPQTLPEGGLIPLSCPACFEACIGDTLNRLRGMLFPTGVVPGDLQYSDSVQILQSTSEQFKRRVLDFTTMSEHYIRW